MNEEWKTILEAPDYEVSNTGKIRNKKSKNGVKTRVVKRFGYVLVNLQMIFNGWVFDCPGVEIEEVEE